MTASRQNLKLDEEAGADRKSRKNLVTVVSQKLRGSIVGGGAKPGDKLPSENEMTQQYGVSRTVIREAIASLRADGLVEARHGVGVFVRAAQPQSPPGLLNPELGRISSIIEMLELRAAVEIEAAGLAAIRRSPAQEELILEAYSDLADAMAKGEATAQADFQFHLSIADATNNPRFREFLKHVGQQMIPRASLQEGNTELVPSDYLAQIQKEHKMIADAISQQDEQSAREAMRTHLKGSQQRYRSQIRRS